ncbi:MAG: tetratricopeptide repeat protein [Planctomycetes bacterium]|nr:tetratricopeptide repeat protein [Planctomycetota bacterium]
MWARFLLGLVCGWVLSRLRLVPGDVWLEGPAVAASSALLVRGAAVAFVGLALRRIAGDPGAAFLCGLAAAVAGHGLWLGGPLGRPAWDVLVAGLLLGLAAWHVERRPDGARETPVPAPVGERLGLFLAGGGAAVVLEIVARHLRLLGGGLTQDDSAFGAVFVGLVALGGVCFGWLARITVVERFALPWLVAAVAAAGFGSLATLRGVAQIREFALFLKRYGLDASWHGTLQADALLAGAALVAPAFLLGVALRAARGRGGLASLLVGAGAGLALLPRFLERDPSATTSTTEFFSAQFLPFALLVTLLGAGLALLSVPGRSARARWIAFAAALPLALPLLVAEAKPLLVLSPWERRPTMPFVVVETPEGLATVEPGAGGLKLATLDRRKLSPGLDGVRADTQTIEGSFRALPEDVRASRAVRVLLVGQLTQARAAVLAREGAARIDRTGAWHAAMPLLERELLQDYPLPPGEIVTPREAAERLASGAYDLCLVLAAEGDPPRWRAIDPPPGRTVIVRWSATEEPPLGPLPGSRFAGTEDREPRVVLAGGGLERLRLGVLDGSPRPALRTAGRLELVELERIPAPAPWRRLVEHKVWRAASARLAAAEAIEAANPGPLGSGIRSFAALQVPSSPFETESEQVELDTATLDLLRAAGLAEPPSAFVREAWNWLARVLAGKRDVEAIEAQLAPLAAAHAPWPELEVALARADLEALDAASARRRLAPLAAHPGAGFEVLAVLGEALEQLGDPAGAVSAYKRALELRPADLPVRRRLAMAQVRAGDPEGEALVQSLLAEHPEDEELRAFLGPGPWPPPPAGPAVEPRTH